MEIKEKVNDTLLEENNGTQIKAYKRRWVILTIFMIYAAVNSFQWIEYSSITHIVVKYYNVSTLAVDWTSIIYMALYPIFVIPASYIIDKKGLRTAGIIGCIGTLIGTSIKVFSIRRDLFFVILLGQAIVSASQIVILSLPPKIAAVWFKLNEVSTACSLGVIGSQVGNALGYLIPPILVQNSDDLEVIGSGLRLMSWLLTGVMVFSALAVIFYFPDQPPLPPSTAQATLRNVGREFDTKHFFRSLKKLFLNGPLLIHMVAYGINLSVFAATGTLLNQFILQYLEGANEDVGRMGFLMVLIGIVGMFGFGVLLDKTHKYKETTFFIYTFSTISVVLLMFSLKWRSLWAAYVSVGIFGFFMNAYMPVGYEMAIELTYPSEESTTTGILLATTQLLGTPFSVGTGFLNKWLGGFWSLAILAVLMVFGIIVTGCVPNRLLRQEAFRQDGGDLKRKVSHHGSRMLYIQ